MVKQMKLAVLQTFYGNFAIPKGLWKIVQACQTNPVMPSGFFSS